MNTNLPSPPPDNTETKNAFRKPSGDATNRNYRRHSPVEGSPSPDGSPRHDRGSSPNQLREDSVRISDHHSRKYDDRERDRHYGRNHYGRSSDSFRHSDRQSSRSSYGHSRHEEYVKNDKYGDEERYRERLSSRSGHESRGDHLREEGDRRSKDYQRAVDKYSRDKYDRSGYRSKENDRETSLEHQKYKDKDSSYDRSGSGRSHAPYDEVERERRTRDRDGRDERRDSRRSSGDHRSDRAISYSESRSQRDSGKGRLKEDYYKSEQKELDGQKLPWEEKRKYDDSEIGRDKDQDTKKVGEQFGNDDKESSGKKQKLFGVEKDEYYGKDDERKTSSSKLAQESKADLGAALTTGMDGGTDIDAAKVAAMKAAELVNRNLVGVGCLTTDQKKKLLWGNKKSTTVEESGHRWDTGMFSDRERQEKFNKLMSLRLYWCLWQIVGCERGNQGGAKLQQPKWQRCTSCGEGERTPAGSRETVHRRASPKRWPHSWIRPLNIHFVKLASFDICHVFLYHDPKMWRILLLVCFRLGWEFIYALMSGASLSLGSWWEFLVRHQSVIAMEFLIMIVSKFLSFYGSYKTGLGNWTCGNSYLLCARTCMCVCACGHVCACASASASARMLKIFKIWKDVKETWNKICVLALYGLLIFKYRIGGLM